MSIDFFKNRAVGVTGACGTIGSELVRQLLEDYGVSRLVCMDNNESALFFLESRFSDHNGASFYIGDVRDRDKLVRKFKGLDLVFHVAAFKHVTLCERSPFEAIQTNILGVKNIIDAAFEADIGRVIFTSSDKAVNPTNVMGTSKLMGERLMTAANLNAGKTGPRFSSTRFGNVLGSRGSVIPIFINQIRNGGPVTLTDPLMTRFIMSIQDAVRLLIDSATCACGGEIMVTKMPVIAIKDLAQVMIAELAPVFGHDPEKIQIKEIGSKPGEKLYEELLSHEETRRTWELSKYFAVLPTFKELYDGITYAYDDIVSQSVNREYNSSVERMMTKDELRQFIRGNGLLREAGIGLQL